MQFVQAGNIFSSITLMGTIIGWIIDDNQKDLFEFLVALVLNILFLTLSGLLLWPLDRLMLVFGLAKGYGLLWAVMLVTAGLLNRLQRFFRKLVSLPVALVSFLIFRVWPGSGGVLYGWFFQLY